jgi:hypothetical protein
MQYNYELSNCIKHFANFIAIVIIKTVWKKLVPEKYLASFNFAGESLL